MTDWQHTPITVAAIESDPEYVWVDGDKTYDHYDFTFSRDNWQRIREGRACLRCWELQPIPFLTATEAQCRKEKERHLPGCAYEGDGIQTKQRADIAAEFRGEKWVGPTQKLEDALAEDDERREKYERETGLRPGPWVPPWVKV
ncbi:MAG: hypothetical protein WC565_02990 [Parcubacteria group bacterium]